VALEIVRELRGTSREGGSRELDHRIRQMDQAIEALTDAQEGGRRITHIIKDMAALARPDALRQRVHLPAVVRDALHWLPPAVAQAAIIAFEDQGAPDVLASPGQVSQVIVNLVTNAVKACPAGERAKVLVRTGTSAAGRARLNVIDHGVGISPELLHKIFEPFFTTRPVGEHRGTGLGLSICDAIVKAHGGTISVKSEVGKGSTFTVELPAAPRVPASAAWA
jgi:two-component system NtrC family sensor kinase